METYVGQIVQVRFYSEESKFLVAMIYEESLDKHILVTGSMYELREEGRYRFFGDYMIHPKYGKQFKFTHYEEVLANDYEEVIRYLSSPLFKGIGKKQATYIVDALGNHALEIIKEDHQVLDHIKGMSETKKATIIEVLSEQNVNNEIIQFLMVQGIGMALVDKILQTYKEEAMSIIIESPYQLIEDIEGISFKIVDKLALASGIETHDKQRIQAVVYHLLKDMCYQQGHTYILEESLLLQARRFDYSIEEVNYRDTIQELIEKKKIYRHQEKLLADIYEEAEEAIASGISYFLSIEENLVTQDNVEEHLNRIQERDLITFDESQKEAISLFLNSPFMVLTGGPGTGKTTIVKAALEMYRQQFIDDEVALVAPTGRAAKRLSELTQLEAQTIHRLLKWDVQKNEFFHDKTHPIDASLVIIDEFSMVDTVLFSKLLEACKKVRKILIIGDHEQLPSVSPGNVLRDLLSIETIPTIRLNKIYRQKESSGIAYLAYGIRQNDEQLFAMFNEYRDINFLECLPTQVLTLTKRIVEKAVSEGYTNQDIQVLAPMYQGVAGIDALNDMLQDIMNPKTEFHKEIRIGQKLYREGDKILQLKNRVDDNVFNGDIGILVEINFKDNVEYFSDTLVVDYEGHMVEYTSSDFIQMTLAYCMSVHKSQGSEFKIVILPVVNDYSIMLQKNLIYTGITRAKQSLFMIGQKQAFDRGLHTTNKGKRETYLKERFEVETAFSPYDFLD